MAHRTTDSDAPTDARRPNRRRVLTSAATLTLATNALLLSATPTVAHAADSGQGVVEQGVTAAVGQVVSEAPPATIAQGSSENNRDLQLFQEQASTTLASPLPVNIAGVSSYPTSYTDPSQLPNNSVLPAGSVVDSYFLYSDPVGTPTTPVPYAATLSFSSPIVAVIFRDQTLNSSDAALGVDGTSYTPQTLRGFELGSNADQITFVSANTINIRTRTSIDTDQIRILTAGTASGSTSGPAPSYTEVASDGGIFTFGSKFLGSEGGKHLNKPMVGGAQALVSGGYWTVASDGGIFSFGGAPFYGSTGKLKLNSPIVAMAATNDGLGYRLIAADGGLFSYGDAVFAGSEGSTKLNKPIVGGASDPGSSGYWMVASDGGVFSFGAAGFFGSTGNIALNKPIVGMAPTPDGLGYWMVASDGGIFAFGDAAFYGSTGNISLNQPIVGMKATGDGKGYWLFASDGGVFSFGDAQFLGSMGAVHLNQPIVGAF